MVHWEGAYKRDADPCRTGSSVGIKGHIVNAVAGDWRLTLRIALESDGMFRSVR